MINLCPTNQLGLADHPNIEAAAKAELDRSGFGMASIRFICGTQIVRRELDLSIAHSPARPERSSA